MLSSTLLTLLTTPFLLTVSAHALSLSQFQPIVSFPAACTAAYNAPISGCQAKDFSGGNPCSKTCIDSLQAISANINTACVGTRADPTTLIGLFFQGTGVSTLCPNVVAVSAGAGSSDGGNGIIGESTLTASSATSVESSIVAATSAAASSNTRTASSSKKVSKTATSTTRESTAVQTSTTSTRASSKADTTSKSITTTSTGLRGGFTTTAVNNGVASVITDKAQQSANPDGFGGGGSPFEVGVSGGITLRISSTLLVSFVVGMGMMLR